MTTPITDPAPPGPPEARGSVLGFISPVWFTIITLCLIFFLYQIVGGVVTFFVTGASVSEENVDTARWLTLGGQLLFILVPTLALTRLRHGSIAGFFAMRRVNLRELGVVLISVFALQQVLQGYMFLQELLPIPDVVDRFIAPYKDMIEQTYRVLVTAESFPEFLFVVLVVAIVPSVVEELLFRGLIQNNLQKVFVGLRAAVAAGLVFAAYHLVPFTFVPLAILGIYFGYIVLRSANLSLAIGAHFFNNFLACLAVYLSLEEDFVAMAPVGEVTTSLVLINSTLFLVVFLLSMVMFHRMTATPSFAAPEDSI